MIASAAEEVTRSDNCFLVILGVPLLVMPLQAFISWTIVAAEMSTDPMSMILRARPAGLNFATALLPPRKTDRAVLSWSLMNSGTLWSNSSVALIALSSKLIFSLFRKSANDMIKDGY